MTSQTFDRKPLFDAMRRLLRRGFKRSEVAIIDEAIDDMLEGTSKVVDAPSQAEDSAVPSLLSPVGIALIKRFEGCARKRGDGLIQAYPDPGTMGDPWTIGWGATGPDRFNGGRIGPGTVWTQEQCDDRARQDYIRYANDVTKALGSSINNTSQAQFDAMVSFHYNTGAIGRATLTKRHIAGNHEAAAREFKRWNKAGGRVLKGLVRRRAAEEELYRSGM